MMWSLIRFSVQICIVFVAYFTSTAIGCEQGENDSLTRDTMPIHDSLLAPQDLIGEWVHSHEEDPLDTSGCEVYRPSNWDFGLSRGRRGFQLREENRATVLGIAPTDGVHTNLAIWSLDAGSVLVIREENGTVRHLQIVTVEPDRLVLRELRKTK